MTNIGVRLERSNPAIVIELTPAGLKIELVGWQHNAPVNLLANLDIMVQRAIHQWRARFLQREQKFNTPSATERAAAEEAQVNNSRRAS